MGIFRTWRLFRDGFIAIGLVLSVWTAGAAGAAGEATPLPSVLLLEGATIVDGVSGNPIGNHSLLIEGDKIRAILPATAPVPDGAERLNLDGKFLIPGLLDSHVHWEDWMGELYVNYGVTAVVALRNLTSEFRLHSQTAADLPRLYHSGGRPEFADDSSADEIGRAVEEWLSREPDMAQFPTHNARNARAYARAAADVHKAGLTIFGHAENAPAAIRDGLDIVEHVWGFAQAAMSAAELQSFQDGELLSWATNMTDWNQLDQMIEDAVQNGAYLNPTLLYEWGGMSEQAGHREVEEYLVLSDPDLVYFPKNVTASLLARHRMIKNFSSRYENMPRLDRLPQEDRSQFETGYRNVQEFTRRFAAAGGKIQGGTDVITGGTPGLSLHHEMEMLVEAGLSPMQSLQAATSVSAELLEGKNGARGPAAIGSLQPGYLADLVVLSDDPLGDIANTRKIERVMKGGRWIELGYHPEYFTFTDPPRSVAASVFAPVISSITPSVAEAGSPIVRVALEGSGFTMTSLVRVAGISVKTIFISPRRVEFDLPADLVASASPNPYSPPGPAQRVAVFGDRSVEIHAFNPPPEGGTSNSVHLLVRASE